MSPLYTYCIYLILDPGKSVFFLLTYLSAFVSFPLDKDIPFQVVIPVGPESSLNVFATLDTSLNLRQWKMLWE